MKKLFSISQKYLPSRKGVLGINGRNLRLIYPYNSRTFFPNVDDKLRCKELLSAGDIPVPQTYHIVRGPQELAEWEGMLSGIDDFVVKPNRGYGGLGIMLIRRMDSRFIGGGISLDAKDIVFHVMQICNGAFSLDNTSDTAFFEEMIVNDSRLSALIPEDVEGVADIRIVFRLEQPVMAMVRLPTRESDGKANLHMGGIGVGIDLTTGLTLNGCYRNRVITTHPETGVRLRGRPVPHFMKMIEYGEKISGIVGLGYIGVDLACDRRLGPVVLEVNARPGLNIQIANQLGLGSRLI